MQRPSQIVLRIGTGMIGMVLVGTGILLLASFLPNHFNPYLSLQDRLLLLGMLMAAPLCGVFVLIRAWQFHRRQQYGYACGLGVGAFILALFQALFVSLMRMPPIG